MLSRIPIDDSTKDEPENPILQGKYLGRYEIPQKWEIPRSIKLEYEHIQEYHSIQIEGGEFIINPSVIKYYSIKEGEEFAFKSIGLELWAWQPTK